MPTKKPRRSQPVDTPAANSGYDAHEMRLRTHAFVQALMQRSCLKDEKAKALYTSGRLLKRCQPLFVSQQRNAEVDKRSVPYAACQVGQFVSAQIQGILLL